jgi:hypothetical protein
VRGVRINIFTSAKTTQTAIDLTKMDDAAKKQAEECLTKMIKNKIITKQQYDSIKK